MRVASLRVPIAAALVCAAFCASAQTVPPAVGSDLLRSCSALVNYAAKGGEITVDATSCAAYLKGLREGVDAPTPSRSATERVFCAGGVSLDEMARAVVKHVQERPENARRQASAEAIAALVRAYPCAKKQP